MKRKVQHWVPLAFCAVLSLIALGGAMSGDWWQPAFFSFLPLCFLFVGAVTYQMQAEIAALRNELTALRGEGTDAGPEQGGAGGAIDPDRA